MTTAECWAAISAILGELKKRIKNREDIEFFHKLESRYQEAQECQRKELLQSDASHAEAMAKKDETIAKLTSEIAEMKKLPKSAPRGLTFGKSFDKNKMPGLR